MTSSKASARVFGLGQCCLDHLVLSRDFPLPDRKVDCTDLQITGGGPVATALVALAWWGTMGLEPAFRIPWEELDQSQVFYTDGVYAELAEVSQIFVVSEAVSEAWHGPGKEEQTCLALAALGVELAGVSLDFSAWVAAQVATAQGGRAGIPDLEGYPGEGDQGSSPRARGKRTSSSSRW